jgi:hypothetical protein
MNFTMWMTYLVSSVVFSALCLIQLNHFIHTFLFEIMKSICTSSNWSTNDLQQIQLHKVKETHNEVWKINFHACTFQSCRFPLLVRQFTNAKFLTKHLYRTMLLHVQIGIQNNCYNLVHIFHKLPMMASLSLPPLREVFLHPVYLSTWSNPPWEANSCSDA